MKEHYVYPKPIILPHIASGRKDLEVRVCDVKRLQIKCGDCIVFADTYRRKVTAIRRYKTFEEMLSSENPGRIMPGWSKEQVLRGIRNIYSPEKEKLGVLVFQLEVIA